VPDDPARRSRPFSAAGALFFDSTGRVMLVRPTYKTGWDIPGGYVEQDESPLAACRREVNEELGITPPIGRLLVVDWAPHPNEGDKVLYIFDGDELSPADVAAIRLDHSELAEYAFYSVEEATSVLVPRLARRLAAAARAHRERLTFFLEHGQEPDFGYQIPQLPAPWTVLPLEKRGMFEAELGAEVSEGHPLFGMPVIAIAKCQACDEVAFSVEHHPVRFVSVHLTWRRAAERIPWPMTKELSLPLAHSLAEHAH